LSPVSTAPMKTKKRETMMLEPQRVVGAVWG
jgi:hypothetical protein